LGIRWKRFAWFVSESTLDLLVLKITLDDKAKFTSLLVAAFQIYYEATNGLSSEAASLYLTALTAEMKFIPAQYKISACQQKWVIYQALILGLTIITTLFSQFWHSQRLRKPFSCS